MIPASNQSRIKQKANLAAAAAGPQLTTSASRSTKQNDDNCGTQMQQKSILRRSAARSNADRWASQAPEARDDAKVRHATDALEEQIGAAHLNRPEDARLRDVHMISSCSGRETILCEGHPEREGRVLVHDSDVPRDERKVHALVRQTRSSGGLRRGDEGNSSDEIVR
jgi:hypothetical protein